jgi:transposase
MTHDDVQNLKDSIKKLDRSVKSSKRIIRAFEKIPDSPAGKEKLYSEQKIYIPVLEEKCRLLKKLTIEQEKLIEELKLNNKRSNQQVRYAYGKESKSNAASSQDNSYDSKNTPKKRGAPKGHKGNTRSIPDKVDFTQRVSPPDTCTCGCNKILELEKYDIKYLEDIPPVNKVVTEMRYMRGKCCQCGEILRHPNAIKGPPVNIGSNLAVHLSTMRQAGVTYRKLSAFCTETLGIELSPSGVLGIVNRVADRLKPYYKTLEEALKIQEIVHADETGWKVNSIPWYIWCFCNKKLAYFYPIKSRASQVVKDILGEDFEGIVVCDFYAAYNCIKKTQRCLVHLLRDISDERKILKNSVLLKKFDDRIRCFINDGLRIQKMESGDLKETEIRKMEKALTVITNMKVTKGKAETLIKRIKKYQTEIIRFVNHPELEYHNNRAERQIRPIVISRKISYQSNTDEGAKKNCILHSVMETLRLQKLKPVVIIKQIMSANTILPVFQF